MCPNCFARRVTKDGYLWRFQGEVVRFCPLCGHRLDRRLAANGIPKGRLEELAREYVHPLNDGLETLYERALIDVLSRFGAQLLEERLNKR